jgi:hypothetical protein
MTLPALPYSFSDGGTIYASQMNANNTQIVADAAAGGANADITSLVGTGGGVEQHGVVTNSNAAAGYVGQYIESDVPTGSAVTLTSSGTTYDITHVSLTAGDWDVSGVVLSKPDGGTTTSCFSVWTSITTADSSPDETDGLTNYSSTGTGVQTGGTTGTVRYSLASTTSVYLSCVATFASSTMSAFGLIRARRVR